MAKRISFILMLGLMAVVLAGGVWAATLDDVAKGVQELQIGQARIEGRLDGVEKRIELLGTIMTILVALVVGTFGFVVYIARTIKPAEERVVKVEQSLEKFREYIKDYLAQVSDKLHLPKPILIFLLSFSILASCLAGGVWAATLDDVARNVQQLQVGMAEVKADIGWLRNVTATAFVALFAALSGLFYFVFDISRSLRVPKEERVAALEKKAEEVSRLKETMEKVKDVISQVTDKLHLPKPILVFLLSFLLLASCLIGGQAWGAVPPTINIQGKYSIYSGQSDVNATFYVTGNNKTMTDNHGISFDSSGIFNTSISIGDPTIFAAGDAEVKIFIPATNSPATDTPTATQTLNSVPYAFRAAAADSFNVGRFLNIKGMTYYGGGDDVEPWGRWYLGYSAKRGVDASNQDSGWVLDSQNWFSVLWNNNERLEYYQYGSLTPIGKNTLTDAELRTYYKGTIIDSTGSANYIGNLTVGGNVGIGTNLGENSATGIRLVVAQTGAGNYNAGAINLSDSGNKKVWQITNRGDQGSGGMTDRNKLMIYHLIPAKGMFGDTWINPLTIDENGDVGIGTSDISRAKLEVKGLPESGASVAIFGQKQGISIAQSWPLIGFNSYYVPGIGWKSISDGYAGAIGLDSGSGAIKFYRGTNNTIADQDVTLTESMSITNDGVININNSSASPLGLGGGLKIGSYGTTYKWIQSYDYNPLSINPLGNGVAIGKTIPVSGFSLDVNGNTRVGETLRISGLSGNGTRYIGVDNTGNVILVATPAPSDLRLKTNIETISDKIDVINALNKLRGIYFNWDTKKEAVKDKGNQREIGMIAQEVEQVMPELVTTNNDGYKSLDYAKMVSFLVEVNKAQQNKINDLEARIKALEGKVK